MNNQSTPNLINQPIGSLARLEDGNYHDGHIEIQVENGIISRHFNLDTDDKQLNFDKELFLASASA